VDVAVVVLDAAALSAAVGVEVKCREPVGRDLVARPFWSITVPAKLSRGISTTPGTLLPGPALAGR